MFDRILVSWPQRSSQSPDSLLLKVLVSNVCTMRTCIIFQLNKIGTLGRQNLFLNWIKNLISVFYTVQCSIFDHGKPWIEMSCHTIRERYLGQSSKTTQLSTKHLIFLFFLHLTHSMIGIHINLNNAVKKTYLKLRVCLLQASCNIQIFTQRSTVKTSR